MLKLNSSKAEKYLNWKPILEFKETAQMTTSWYKNYYKDSSNVFHLSKQQILEYSSRLNKLAKSYSQKK